MERKLSQAESKLVADWLRQKGVSVANALVFWRKTPAVVAELVGLSAGLSVKVTAKEVARAAGREDGEK